MLVFLDCYLHFLLKLIFLKTLSVIIVVNVHAPCYRYNALFYTTRVKMYLTEYPHNNNSAINKISKFKHSRYNYLTLAIMKKNRSLNQICKVIFYHTLYWLKDFWIKNIWYWVWKKGRSEIDKNYLKMSK